MSAVLPCPSPRRSPLRPLAIPALAAPPPRLTHTPVSTCNPGGRGRTSRRRSGPGRPRRRRRAGWADEVPAAGHHDMCCFDSWEGSERRGGGCRIEDHGSFSIGNSEERFAEIDDETAVILLRAEQGRISPRARGLAGMRDRRRRPDADLGRRRQARGEPGPAVLAGRRLGRRNGRPRQGDRFRDHGHRGARRDSRGRRARAAHRSRAAGTDPQEDGVLDGEHARPPRVRSAEPAGARRPERQGARAGSVRAEPEAKCRRRWTR